MARGSKETLTAALIAADGGNSNELTTESKNLIKTKCELYAEAIEEFIKSASIKVPALTLAVTSMSATGGPVTGETVSKKIEPTGDNPLISFP
jgi:hypothetical protein